MIDPDIDTSKVTGAALNRLQQANARRESTFF